MAEIPPLSRKHIREALAAVIAGLSGALMVIFPALGGAIVAIVFVFWLPELSLIVAVLFVEEQLSSGALRDEKVHFVVKLGTDILYGGSPPRVFLFILIAAVVVLVRRTNVRLWDSPQARLSITILGSLAAWTFINEYLLFGLTLKQSFTAAVSWVVAIAALVIGISVSNRPRTSQHAIKVGFGAVVGKFLVAVVVVALGAGQPLAGKKVLVFYDTALASFAAAVAVAMAYARDLRPAIRWPVGAMSLIITLLSFRRGVWIAALIIASIVIPIAQRNVRIAVKSVVSLVAVIFLLLVVVPSIADVAMDRFIEGLGTVTGNTEESSAAGHLSDLAVAYDVARASPLNGLGYRHPQLAGLVVSKPGQTIYVHSDYLEVWLREGIVGLALLLFFVAILTRFAFRALREELTVPEFSAAVLLLIAPLVMIWFPILSTTWRWPAMIGLALGLLIGRLHVGPNAGLVRPGGADVSMLVEKR
jgi:O-antigen ligase